MTQPTETIQLVEQARLGSKDAVERLAELATGRLRAHVYRLTLREDVTQEIVQESVLEMLRVIGNLRQADRFWPWLYGIAMNKLHHHNRDERRHKARRFDEIGFGGADPAEHKGMENVLAQELRQIVAAAMGGLKPRHRAVLSMRCYDDMSYGQIAHSLGCSEFAAQMLFYRAKRALAKQLSRQGLGKGALLMALALFGKMTATSEAAAAQLTVGASAVKVGLGAAIVGALTTKAVILTVAAIGVAGGGAALKVQMDSQSPMGDETIAAAAPTDTGINGRVDANCQSWYFFPDGAAGAVMRRRVAFDESGRELCMILENEHANYHYDRAAGVVYIDNARALASGLSVALLPNDPPGLRQFLTGTRGAGEYARDAKFMPARRNGLLVITGRRDGDSEAIEAIARHENLLEEEYFQSCWSAGTSIIDRRDAMHKRGWTQFSISGNLDGKAVTGGGRIPFVYAALRACSPWLQLHVGDVSIVDTVQGSALSVRQEATSSYAAGWFFLGLGRPWMGLHTADTVRRDAAAFGVLFETKVLGDGKMQVALNGGDARVVYTINPQADLIEEIELAGEHGGRLVFTYSQTSDASHGRPAPSIPAGAEAASDTATLWLMEVARNGFSRMTRGE